MRVLVTRPQPDAERTAQALRGRGHEVLVAPLLHVETVEAEFRGPYGAVLMTSANAARAASRHPSVASLLSLPVVTVGHRTAKVAQDAGFTLAGTPGGSLADLTAFVPTIFGPGTPLLYLAGEDRAGDLAAALAPHRLTVDTIVIYRAVAATRLPDLVIQALLGVQLDGVLHYSQRSASTLLVLSEQAGVLGAVLDLAHFCISDEVTVPLRSAGAKRVAVAPHPDGTALIGLT